MKKKTTQTKKNALLIFPNQLFDVSVFPKDMTRIVLLEHKRFFSSFSFHKQKIMMHRASMKAYEKELKKAGYKVTYKEHDDAKRLTPILRALKEKDYNVHIFDVVDHDLEGVFSRISKKLEQEITVHENPNFLTKRKWIEKYYGEKQEFSFLEFYRRQRKRLNILMKNGKPVGGKWTFDGANRKKLPKTVNVPELPAFKELSVVKEAREYCEKKSDSTFGDTQKFIHPVTRSQARKRLKHFLEKRFSRFGPYQDAISKKEPFIFHSLISSALNIGLLSPQEVVDEALEYAKAHKIPTASLEGFIRQVIGWREYMRLVYVIRGKTMRLHNVWKNKRHISPPFWHGTTGIDPVDKTIKKVYKYAYAHHIERLMVLGNFFLLCEIHPDDVYKWFMENFIDAYDWVMVPNIYGMSQFSDGGQMVTKPYISSSNYILKMSDYTKGHWSETWDHLYWRFLNKHRDFLKEQPRMAMVLKLLEDMDEEKITKHKQIAKAFLSSVL